MPNNSLTYLLMVLVAFIWGSTFNAVSLSLTAFHPISVALLRSAISAIVLLFVGRREIFSTPVKKNDWFNFFLLGLSGVFVNNLFFMYSMKYTSPVNGSLITGINPVVTALLATLLLKDKLTLRLAGGALFSFIGVALVISSGSWHVITALEFNSGDLLTLGAVLGCSFYAITCKRVSDSFSPMITTFYSFFTGTLLLLPFGLLVKPGPAWPIHARIPATAAVLYLALIGSVLAFFWWNKGISILGAGRSAVFLNLIPVATIIISLSLKETITPVQVAGCVLIIGAVTIAAGLERDPAVEKIAQKKAG